jgi:hypothetical protein
MPDSSTINEVISDLCVPSNNRMQRGGLYKVLGRGRMIAVLEQVRSARVLSAQWPRADAGRWAALANV